MSAEAMVWAISPPITPAPTTAALKTNMGASFHASRTAESAASAVMQSADPTHQMQIACSSPTSIQVSQADKPEAREREHRGDRPGPLAVTGERAQDGEVAEQPQQRHRHPREVRVGRLLHRRAAVGDRAHRLAARVVDDGEVARDAEAHEGDRDRRGAPP